MPRRPYRELKCGTWSEMLSRLKQSHELLDVQDGEDLWYRGCVNCRHKLIPSLMRLTARLSDDEHDEVEGDLFFEFQARAAELRARGLSDWEYLFFGRHYGVPTRLLDWTDTFGVALYFATENRMHSGGTKITKGNQNDPAIWVLNPFALNVETLEEREITLPRYLGLDECKDDYWDFGELLASDGEWGWDGPAAIYPVQINDRVQAQSGWFTIHGNDRRPLEAQLPDKVVKLVLGPRCVQQSLEILRLAGLHRFSMYPDLDNLADWLSQQNRTRIRQLRSARKILK